MSAVASAISNDLPAADLLRKLAARGTVRNFKPDPIPEPWLDALLAAGQRAPSSSNIQACSVIVVRDPDTKARLAELAGNQKHIVDCPVFLAFCADLTRAARACELHGKPLDETFEIGLVASIDAALVGMTVSVVAEAMGLGNVFIGAMRNKPIEVAELLGLPPRVYVTFGMCLGFAKAPPHPKPRVPLAAFIHHERYDTSDPSPALDAYDAELAGHYREQGRPTTDRSWTEATAKAFSVSRRKALRGQLQTLGFPLE